MLRKATFLVLFAGLALLLSVPAQAQAGAEVQATANLHMRFGAGSTYNVITIIGRGTKMSLEARNSDITWFLVHTDDGVYRGWIPNQYVSLPSGYNAFTLPFSSEVVTVSKPASVLPTAAPTSGGNTAPDAAAPGTTNSTVTVVPPLSSSVVAQIRQIALRGRKLGNHANAYIKLGDSITAYHLLFSFADRNAYDLGKYTALQSTISFFNQSHSLNAVNLTAATGFTSVTELDATWSDPQFCDSGEALLPCEIRRSKPAIALIYLGPNDMDDNPLNVYASYLAQDVQMLIDNGVIPVLYTFAIRGDRFPDRQPQYEGVIYDIAARQHVPIIDFYNAARTLPDNGVVADAFHMTHRDDWSVHFTGDESKYGETLLELLSLQMLDQIRRSAF